MSEMAKQFFAGNPALSGPLIALIVFVFVFVVAAVRAFRAERAHIDRLARLPLESESEGMEEGRG